ncbi:MAG: nucleotidyltransferase [Candidatus Scalindua rubra]|uniref:Nucleotidyltransferase n=1 Tax=Candidatus Scalindua rubra TaxID=1872076 RepID=A0A1E3X4R2_9BACT|nr:MAG: nucleotidyltransferase [Candidatus Scalindua rubra]
MAQTKKLISIEEIKDRLKPIFQDKGLQLVLLFGSVVSGGSHRHSDIDIAFLFDTTVDILALTNRVIRLLHVDNIDVVDLRRASPLLKFSVVNKSKLLYEREEGIVNTFYSLAFRMYIDTKKLRDAQALAIKHFLREKDL